MGSLLAAMGTREFNMHRPFVTSLIDRVQRDLTSNSLAALHGSLLALREFFLYPEKVKRSFAKTLCC